LSRGVGVLVGMGLDVAPGEGPDILSVC